MAHLKDLIVNGPARILGKIMSPVFSDSVSMGRVEDTDIGASSVALGYQVIASGVASHAEGSSTTASGSFSHAEGYYTNASGYASHAEGNITTASVSYSHAEGDTTTASGQASHAEGSSTTAFGTSSHAEGCGTIASGQAQHVEGKYNIEDTESTYLHIAGNGTGVNDRSNAHTLDWDGNAWFAGDVEADGQISSTHVNATHFQTIEGNLGIQDDGIWTTDGTLKVNAETVALERNMPTVYPAASCTTYTSDSGTCTPLAIQQGAKQFAIPRVGYTSHTDKGNTTDKAIVRFSGTESDVQDSKIIIEDVTNTKDTSKKAQVIAIPAEGNKKMVYGYCTDQTDGTSFIGGIFDKSATSYPYASGLAIGGTSGNLLWKGKQVATTDMITANTDTNVTNTLATTTKAYVTGTTSATTNTGTQVFDTGVYLDTTAGQLVATKFKGNLDGSASKLGSTTIGSSTTPIYLNAGTPTACGFKVMVADNLPTASSDYNGTICVVY